MAIKFTKKPEPEIVPTAKKAPEKRIEPSTSEAPLEGATAGKPLRSKAKKPGKPTSDKDDELF